MDLKANVYIDDGICSAKSQLEPMQCSCWLGFLIDLGKGTFQVPQDCTMYPKLHEYLQQVSMGELV